MYRVIVFIVIWFSIAVSTPSFAADFSTFTVEVKNLKDSIITSRDDKPYTISYPKSANLIQLIQPGNRIEVVLDSGDPSIIKELKKVSKPCASSTRGLALSISFLIIIGLFSLVTQGKPNEFIRGADGRYSNSKFQVVLWFSALMTVYMATLGLRGCLLGWDYFGGIGITENLLALSGISTLTYGAAKAITVQKATATTTTTTTDAAVTTATTADAAITTTATDAAVITATTDAAVTTDLTKVPSNICTDLFKNNDGEFDLGDTQIFFFIILAVVTFLMMSFHFLGWLEYTPQIILPDIDTTLLSGLGLGQGAYLAKKAASNPGKG
jgi:hypothetical protein